jgi:hypothetical protein
MKLRKFSSPLNAVSVPMQRISAITLILLEKLRVNSPEHSFICQEMQGVKVPNFPMLLLRSISFGFQ